MKDGCEGSLFGAAVWVHASTVIIFATNGAMLAPAGAGQAAYAKVSGADRFHRDHVARPVAAFNVAVTALLAQRDRARPIKQTEPEAAAARSRLAPAHGALANSKFWTTKFLDRHSLAAVRVLSC